MNAAALLLILAFAPPQDHRGPPGKVGKLFLDQTKTLAPGQEWSRRVTDKDFIGGWIRYRIDSPGSFTFTFVTQEGYEELQKPRKAQRAKTLDWGILTKQTHKRPRTAWHSTWRDGAHWFIIRNNQKRRAKVRLRCWWPDYSPPFGEVPSLQTEVLRH